MDVSVTSTVTMMVKVSLMKETWLKTSVVQKKVVYPLQVGGEISDASVFQEEVSGEREVWAGWMDIPWFK